MDSVHELLSHTSKPVLLTAETDDLRLMQEHAQQEQEIIMQAKMLEDSCLTMRNLVDSHWIIAQQSEPVIWLTTEWLKHPKNDHSTVTQFLQGHVPDQVQHQFAAQQEDFVLKKGLLYLETTPSHSNKDMLAFIVPTHKCCTAINVCH